MRNVRNMHAQLVHSIVLLQGNGVVKIARVLAVYGDDELVGKIFSADLLRRDIFRSGFFCRGLYRFGKVPRDVEGMFYAFQFRFLFKLSAENFCNFPLRIAPSRIRSDFYGNFVAAFRTEICTVRNENIGIRRA